ncbi:MAG: hypothetical protein JW723_12960 [Bacteroidales bacterium]|nr:hypothetical protein [Bacteroidales bacterium]
MIKKVIYVLLAMILIASCKSGGDKADSLDLDDSDIVRGELEVSGEVMQDIIQSVSSPVEMAALVKGLGVEFSNKYLAPTDDVDELTTSFQKAYHLGIYGADLGYLNMYNKTANVIDYISAIKTLADGIRVGQFFDFTTLKRLAQSSQNLDSLMYLSVHSFNQMDQYLRDNNRSNLSALMVIGVWVEGQYLATQVAKEAPHPDLAERIGEQKIILEKLILIVKNFAKNKQFENLLTELNKIYELYKDIEITIIPGEPEPREENGMLIFVQNEESVVKITDEQLNTIIKTTEEVRNKLINM